MNRIKKVSITTIAGLAILGTTVFGTTGKVYNTSQGLVLREEASKTGTPLATVANDAEVEIIENLGEWYKVKANGKEGYLFAEYVQLQEEQQVQQTPEDTIHTEPLEDNNNKTKSETKVYIMPVITSSTIGEIPINAEVKTEKTLNNWSYISYENIKGWVRTHNINEEAVQTPEVKPEEESPEVKPEEQPEKPTEEPIKPEENANLSFTKGYINSSSVNVRSQPNTSSEIVTTLILNTGVSITAQTEEWYKVTYGNYTGYIYKPLISETPTATSRGSEVRKPETTENQNEQISSKEPVVQEQTVYNPTAGEKIVSFAKQYLGYSYVWGGTTPSGGFDCSGFVYYVFNSCGYNLSRSCTVQANSGVAVSKAGLQPGDIVFFNNTSNGSIGHVGIYIGDGRFIHAANSRRGVVTDTINSGYYNTYYYSARRIAN